jgi:hypothetical protein
MPAPTTEDIWDLYDPSESRRRPGDDGLYVVDTETPKRFQLGLGSNVPWIEYVPEDQFRVRRYAGNLPEGQSYIDIADVSPARLPSGKGVKLSIYCDPSGFMEMEACGGCPAELAPGTELRTRITTEYKVLLTNKML